MLSGGCRGQVLAARSKRWARARSSTPSPRSRATCALETSRYRPPKRVSQNTLRMAYQRKSLPSCCSVLHSTTPCGACLPAHRLPSRGTHSVANAYLQTPRGHFRPLQSTPQLDDALITPGTSLSPPAKASTTRCRELTYPTPKCSGSLRPKARRPQDFAHFREEDFFLPHTVGANFPDPDQPPFCSLD